MFENFSSRYFGPIVLSLTLLSFVLVVLTARNGIFHS